MLFDSHGRTGRHGAWSERAGLYRRVLRSSHPVLERTGTARRALTQRGAEGNINQSTADALTMGAGGRAGYIAEHMYARGSRPARRAIDPSDASLEQLQNGVRKQYAEVVRKAAPMLKVDE